MPNIFVPRVGLVEFPEDMPPEKIQEAWNRLYVAAGGRLDKEPEREESNWLGYGLRAMGSGAIGAVGSAAEGAARLLPDDIEQPYVEGAREYFGGLQARVQPKNMATEGIGGLATDVASGVGSTLPYPALPILGGIFGGPVGALIGTGAAGGLAVLQGIGESSQRAAASGKENLSAGEMLAGAGIGATEILPFVRVLSKFGVGKQAVKLLGHVGVAEQPDTIAKMAEAVTRIGPEKFRGIANRLTRLGADLTPEIIGEAFQEGTATALQNVMEGRYNPERGAFDDVLHSGGVGGVVGGLLRGVTGMGDRSRMRQIADELYKKQQEQNTAPTSPAPTIPPSGTVGPDGQMSFPDFGTPAQGELPGFPPGGSAEAPFTDRRQPANAPDNAQMDLPFDRGNQQLSLDLRSPAPPSGVVGPNGQLAFPNFGESAQGELPGFPPGDTTETPPADRRQPTIASDTAQMDLPFRGSTPDGAQATLPFQREYQQLPLDLPPTTPPLLSEHRQMQLDLPPPQAPAPADPVPAGPSWASRVFADVRDAVEDLRSTYKKNTEARAKELGITPEQNKEISNILNLSRRVQKAEEKLNQTKTAAERERIARNIAEIKERIEIKGGAAFNGSNIQIQSLIDAAEASRVAADARADEEAQHAEELNRRAAEVKAAEESTQEEVNREETGYTPDGTNRAATDVHDTGDETGGRDDVPDGRLATVPSATSSGPDGGGVGSDQPHPGVVAPRETVRDSALNNEDVVEESIGPEDVEQRSVNTLANLQDDLNALKDVGKDGRAHYRMDYGRWGDRFPKLRNFFGENKLVNIGKNKGNLGRVITKKDAPVLIAQLRGVRDAVSNDTEAIKQVDRAIAVVQSATDSKTYDTTERNVKSLEDAHAKAIEADRIDAQGKVNDAIAEFYPGVSVELVEYGSGHTAEELGRMIRAQQELVNNSKAELAQAIEPRDVDRVKEKLAERENRLNELYALSNFDKTKRNTNPKLQAVRELGDRIGATVVFFKTSLKNPTKIIGRRTFDGFTLRHIPEFENTIFININSNKPHLAIFGHEYLHLLRGQSENAYQMFKEVVRASLNPAGRAKFDAIRKAKNPTDDANIALNMERQEEEFIADIAGERLSSDGFWEAFEQRGTPFRAWVESQGIDWDSRRDGSRESTTYWKGVRSRWELDQKWNKDSTVGNAVRQVVRVAKALLNKFGEAVKPSFYTNKFISDFKSIDDTLDSIIRKASIGEKDLVTPDIIDGEVENGTVAREKIVPRTEADKQLLAENERRQIYNHPNTEVVNQLGPMFSAAPQTQELLDLEREITLAGNLVSTPQDPAHSVARRAANTVRASFNEARSGKLSDMVDRLRTFVSFHGAPIESRAYGGQMSYKQNTDDVRSIANGLNDLLESGRTGKWVTDIVNFGKLVKDKYNLWEVKQDPNSVVNIASKLKDIGAKANDGKGVPMPLMTAAFSTYMYSKRLKAISKTLDRLKADRQRLRTANPDKKYPAMDATIDRVERWLSDWTPDQIDASDRLEKMYPEFKEVKNMVRANLSNQVDTMVASGRISKELGHKWKEENEDYVPMYRDEVTEESLDGFLSQYTRATSNKSGPKLSGALSELGALPELGQRKVGASGREIPVADIFTNLVRHTFWTTNQSLRNEASKNIIDDYLSGRWQQDSGITLTRISKGSVGNPALAISRYVNGEQEFYTVNDPLVALSFKGLETVRVPKSLKAVANALRTTVTIAPGFSVSQLPQDALRAGLISGVRSPFTAMGHIFQGFAQGLSKNPNETVRTLTHRGVTGDYDYSETGVETLVNDILGVTRNGILHQTVRTLKKMSTASDMAQRIVVHDQTMKEEKDLTLAVIRAREVINFNRAGASRTITALRQTVPFLNAYIQGMDVLYRSMRGRSQLGNGMNPQMARKMFRSHLAKLSLGMIVYSLAMYGDDDYEGANDLERDRYLFVPGTGARIPVPLDVGFMFKVIPERATRYMLQNLLGDNNRPETIKEVASALAAAFLNSYMSPNLLPQALKPVLEVYMNHSMLLDSPIVGAGLERRDKTEQYTENTSEIARLASHILSTKGAGLSPVQIDYLIRGMLGITGTSVAALVDVLTRGSGLVQRPAIRGQDVARAASFGMFAQSDVPKGWNEAYYSAREDVQRAESTFNAFKARADGQGAREYLDDGRWLGAGVPNRAKLKAAPLTHKIDQIKEQFRKAKRIVAEQVRQGRVSSSAARTKIRELDTREQEVLQKIYPILHRIMNE